MDVTPGPQLRRQIVKQEEMVARFEAEIKEWEADLNLPAPDFSGWASAFAHEIRTTLPLVRP